MSQEWKTSQLFDDELSAAETNGKNLKNVYVIAATIVGASIGSLGCFFCNFYLLIVVRPTSFVDYANRVDYLKLNQTSETPIVKRTLIQYEWIQIRSWLTGLLMALRCAFAGCECNIPLEI